MATLAVNIADIIIWPMSFLASSAGGELGHRAGGVAFEDCPPVLDTSLPKIITLISSPAA
jgi:hypothetical protein